MKCDYPKRFFVIGFMIVSLLMGLVFFITNHLDFIIAAFESSKFHLPNICYAIIRTFTCIIIPAIFIYPSLFPYSRIRISKICFWLLGILHLLTLSWIVYFFGAGYGFEDLFDSEVVTFFQEHISNAFVSAQVFWDTYEMISVLFTVILSGIYIAIAINFDDNRKIVRWLFVALILFKVLTPIIYNLIMNQTLFSSFWFTNNFVEYLSIIAFVTAIWIASMDDETWSVSIWDELPEKNEFEI